MDAYDVPVNINTRIYEKNKKIKFIKKSKGRNKMDEHKKLTNEVGAPIPDNENSLTAGPRGPVVMQDVWLMEKMAHFNREVIPERRMHAKG